MKEEREKLDQGIIDEIIETVKKLKYGEVVITVYNSKIVQIEKKEKKRFS